MSYKNVGCMLSNDPLCLLELFTIFTNKSLVGCSCLGFIPQFKIELRLPEMIETETLCYELLVFWLF